MAKTYHPITPSLFVAVKSLIDAGATYEEVHKYYGIATDTISRIKQCETHEEYKQMVAAIALKRREKRKLAKHEPQEPKAVTPPAVNPSPATAHVVIPYSFQHEVVEQLKAQNELLKLISAKLVYIVEQLS